jgi:trehalose 6-phosphate synthase
VDGLFVCSHRGPFLHELVNGKVIPRMGSGGVVTALSALLAGQDVSWLASALTDVDRRVARGEFDVDYGDQPRAHLIDTPPETHRRYYDDACNTTLGLLFHGLVDLAHTPSFDARFRAGWAAYQEINGLYADHIVRHAGSRPVLVEDYHMMLVGDEVRKRAPKGIGPIAYFHHIAWCDPAYFSVLPEPIRREILSKVLSYDTVGFHSRRWADAFLACCDTFLPESNCEEDRVKWQGREVPIVVSPAQVDAVYLRRVLASGQAEQWRRRLRRRLDGRRALVRVDRVDLWKNLLRGFRAYESVVRDHGVEDLAFVALVSRSRLHLPEYRDYLAACQREVRRVNRALNPGGGGGPIYFLLARAHNDHGRALAGLELADATLVNATSDGLNLVAKESVIASGGRGGLVLSENTGVYDQIGRWAYGINPFDVDETAAAIVCALDKGSERSERERQMLAAVESDLPERWLRSRLEPVL